MLGIPYSSSDFDSALVNMSYSMHWDAARVVGITLSAHSEQISDNVECYVENLQSSLARIPAAGSTKTRSKSMVAGNYSSNPMACSRMNWIMLASLMYHLAGYNSSLMVQPSVALVAYEALVAGAEEIEAYGDAAVELNSRVGSMVAFSIAIAESFVALAHFTDSEISEEAGDSVEVG